MGTPGLILEHSFHTNTRAAKWLLEDENLRKLAQAEADVIARWFGLEQEKVQTFTVELPVLKRGMKGDAVRGLQAQLVGYGYDLTVTGNFGPKTENAVECYQEDNGLEPDGIAGPKTRKHMNGLE